MRFLALFFTRFLYVKEYSIWFYSYDKSDKIKYKKSYKMLDVKMKKILIFSLLLLTSSLYAKYFSLQYYTSRTKDYAYNYKKNHCNKNCFVYLTDKGYYTVREGIFKSVKAVNKYIKFNKIRHYAIVPMDLTKLKNNRTNEKVFNIFDVVEKEENKTKKININNKNYSKDINVNVSKKLKLPLYVKLSLELTSNNKPNIAKLLKQYDKLPVIDRVEAEINIGNVGKAYNGAYFNMKHNYSDYLSYKQARDLYMKYSNRLNILTKFNNVDKIKNMENNINLKTHIFNSYYLYISNDLIISQNNNSTYKNIQTLDKEINIGLKTLTNRGSIYAQIGYRKSYETFLEYLLKYNIIIIKHISYEGKLGINQKSDGENTYLLYAGKKDYFSNNFTFNLTNKDSAYLNIDYNRFYSQDSVYLGNSIMEYIKYMHKLRVSYPDFSYYTYFQKRNYKQTDKKGDIKNISTIKNFDTLSKSYYETGIGFLFGWRHYDRYTKIWRPFLDTSIFYNSLTNVGVNIFLGIGGSIYHQDNLSFGINYSTPQNNTSNYFEMLINYNLWF